tara:strand:- start:85 stop:255 length:171 start_codon:yes stop_codon:yes gene_type:complete
MVATTDEASKIVSITRKYLSLSAARKLAKELHEKVGKKSPNVSLRETFRMIYRKLR